MPITPIKFPALPSAPLYAASTDNGTPAVQGTSYSTIPIPHSVVGALGGGTGLSGTSGSGAGVSGDSQSNIGVHGTSQGFDAVVGETNSNAHAGVTGRNLTTGGNGGVGVYGTGGQYAGKFDGNVQIIGILSVIPLLPNANQVTALSVDGNVEFLAALTVKGNVSANDVLIAGGDCAEEFDVTGDAGPGTVMVLTEDGTLQPSQTAYDKKVAGVISGAGEYRPGVILGRRELPGRRMPLALIGRAYCKADAQFAPIEVGDLLTTSPTLGHAMRAVDPLRSFGSVIGKALQPLRTGQGLVAILIALQ